MSIEAFAKKFHKTDRKISKVVHRWAKEKEVQDFLGLEITAGVTIVDYLSGEGLTDALRPEVSKAFAELMKERADSAFEVKALIMEKFESGGASIEGLIRKIQGQLGEDHFLSAVGSKASLAVSGSQEAWDIHVNHEDFDQFVQVKIYSDANGVIEKMREVAAKIDARSLSFDGNEITQIDFAVNSDIFDEVKEKAAALGLYAKVIDVGATREELRGLMEASVDGVTHPLDNFFSELLGGAIFAGAIHGAVNGFLWYFRSKEASTASADTVYSTVISAGGIASAQLTEALLHQAAILADIETIAAVISGPVGGVIIIGAGISARSILKRIFDRRYVVERLAEGNLHLERLTLSLQERPEILSLTLSRAG